MPSYRIPTGELLRKLRPATYRQIVDLLAEPREYVSYREITQAPLNFLDGRTSIMRTLQQ